MEEPETGGLIWVNVSRFLEKRRSNLTQNKVTRKTSDLSQDFKILQDFQEFHICE